MIRDLAARADQGTVALLLLLFVMLAFGAVVVWTARRRREDLETWARLPLDGQAPDEERS